MKVKVTNMYIKNFGFRHSWQLEATNVNIWSKISAFVGAFQKINDHSVMPQMNACTLFSQSHSSR
jgi:hypothetical protein